FHLTDNFWHRITKDALADKEFVKLWLKVELYGIHNNVESILVQTYTKACCHLFDTYRSIKVDIETKEAKSVEKKTTVVRPAFATKGKIANQRIFSKNAVF